MTTDLDNLAALRAKAAPGRWFKSRWEKGRWKVLGPSGAVAKFGYTGRMVDPFAEANAEFVAALVNWYDANVALRDSAIETAAALSPKQEDAA